MVYKLLRGIIMQPGEGRKVEERGGEESGVVECTVVEFFSGKGHA